MKSSLSIFFSLADTGDFNFLMYALNWADSLPDDVALENQQIWLINCGVNLNKNSVKFLC